MRANPNPTFWVIWLAALAACFEDSAPALVNEDTIGMGARLDQPVKPATARANEAPPGETVSVDASSDTAVPATAGDEVLFVEFTELSLVGLDVDAIFDPAEEEAGLSQLPQAIRSLDKRLVSIEGFMIPMEWQGTRVQAFMLVRDMAGCCFGQMPKPDEWVEVVMQEGELADYYPYMPVLVTGIFELAGETDDLGYVTGAYRMRGEAVTDEW